jgi:DNA-binding PadR family transcriptional regulator
MSMEYRVLQAVEARQRAGWHSIRYLDTSPYASPVEALRVLAQRGLLERVPGETGEIYQVAPAGRQLLQQHREELAAQLEDLRQGKLDTESAAQAIETFGREQFREARPVVERFLDNEHHGLHTAALKVLAGDWLLTDDRYRDAALRLLTSDPNPQCRAIAAAILAYIGQVRGDRDPRSLGALARVARDETEDGTVRLAAYRGIRAMLGAGPREQVRLADASSLADVDDVDWPQLDSLATADEPGPTA